MVYSTSHVSHGGDGAIYVRIRKKFHGDEPKMTPFGLFLQISGRRMQLIATRMRLIEDRINRLVLN